jgi:hypothetical protein
MIESFGGWRSGAHGVTAAQPGLGIGQPPAHVKAGGLLYRRRFSQVERLTVILSGAAVIAGFQHCRGQRQQCGVQVSARSLVGGVTY